MKFRAARLASQKLSPNNDHQVFGEYVDGVRFVDKHTRIHCLARSIWYL